MVSEVTKVKVVDAVQLLAKEAQKRDPELTDHQARAEVWRKFPNLVAAWRIAGEPKV